MEVANIYDNGPISPIARTKDNLSIWTVGKWAHFNIANIEPLPRSSPMVAEMVALSGATTLAANGSIAKRIVAILQPTTFEFLHLRWEPLDDVEGVLWEQPGSAKFVAAAVHARVTRFTSVRDPYLATTTFWILGRQRDMNLEVRNPNPVALPQARFVFFGYRYLLTELTTVPQVTTWLPAEGF
ncbi:MAG: hypothetical protein Q7J06_05100 [Bacteroidales bacterium]|nr:hypothetical protein [Bacteroidales bacterium]